MGLKNGVVVSTMNAVRYYGIYKAGRDVEGFPTVRKLKIKSGEGRGEGSIESSGPNRGKHSFGESIRPPDASSHGGNR
jgi:hypothetical protein